MIRVAKYFFERSSITGIRWLTIWFKNDIKNSAKTCENVRTFKLKLSNAAILLRSILLKDLYKL